MEGFGEALLHCVLPDQLDDVGQIPEPVRCGHSGCHLELDQSRERQKREALTADGRPCGIGKDDGLLLTVTRIVTREKHVDVDVLGCIPKSFATWKFLDVPASELLGFLVWSGALSWFGRLPGDIRIERENLRVYVPITSMILVSVVLTLLVNLVRRLF
jgi:hypothetical protein